MPDTHKGFETVHASNRAEWRRWLDAHHADVPGIWLVSHMKASKQPGVSYPEAVEEALCFGWIDSRPNALDDERYLQLFTPANRAALGPKSTSNASTG